MPWVAEVLKSINWKPPISVAMTMALVKKRREEQGEGTENFWCVVVLVAAFGFSMRRNKKRLHSKSWCFSWGPHQRTWHSSQQSQASHEHIQRGESHQNVQFWKTRCLRSGEFRWYGFCPQVSSFSGGEQKFFPHTEFFLEKSAGYGFISGLGVMSGGFLKPNHIIGKRHPDREDSTSFPPFQYPGFAQIVLSVEL